MNNKKILYSIEDGKVVEKTFYIICDKFVDIDGEDVFSKDEINEYDIFKSRNEAESYLMKPRFLPLEEKIKIMKELDLEHDVMYAFSQYYSKRIYEFLNELDISTELRYYLETKLGAYNSKLIDRTKSILSAFNVIY